MAISISAYRASIGLFVNCIKGSCDLKLPNIFLSKFSFEDISSTHNERNCKIKERKINGVQMSLAVTLIIHIAMMIAGDIELNPGPPPSLLNICHANVRSLKNKLLYVKGDLMHKFDIITLSESWLSNKDKSDDLLLEGYQKPYRRDRNRGLTSYGGVLASVKNDIACKRRKDIEPQDLECMWLEIRLKCFKFLLCVLYRPPNCE